MRHVAFVNEAKDNLNLPAGKTLGDLVTALQRWVDGCVTPISEQTVSLRLMTNISQLQAHEYVFAILDQSDVKGAAAYHTVGPNGQPCAKIFLDGGSVSIGASHELKEFLDDMFCDKWRLTKIGFVAEESADPVEETTMDQDGFAMTNFVTREWFQGSTTHPPGTKFDYLGVLKAPLTLSAGGYMSYVKPGSRKVTQIFGEKADKTKKHPRAEARSAHWEKHYTPTLEVKPTTLEIKPIVQSASATVVKP